MALLEIDDKTIEDILINELKVYHSVLNELSEDWYSSDKDRINDTECLEAIEVVLSHYLTREDLEKWLTSTVTQILR